MMMGGNGVQMRFSGRVAYGVVLVAALLAGAGAVAGEPGAPREATEEERSAIGKDLIAMRERIESKDAEKIADAFEPRNMEAARRLVLLIKELDSLEGPSQAAEDRLSAAMQKELGVPLKAPSTQTSTRPAETQKQAGWQDPLRGARVLVSGGEATIETKREVRGKTLTSTMKVVMRDGHWRFSSEDAEKMLEAQRNTVRFQKALIEASESVTKDVEAGTIKDVSTARRERLVRLVNVSKRMKEEEIAAPQSLVLDFSKDREMNWPEEMEGDVWRAAEEHNFAADVSLAGLKRVELTVARVVLERTPRTSRVKRMQFEFRVPLTLVEVKALGERWGLSEKAREKLAGIHFTDDRIEQVEQALSDGGKVAIRLWRALGKEEKYHVSVGATWEE
jgi:hypothetical protein